MKVAIHLRETSQEIVHENVTSYQKGLFYCVTNKETVWKYPIQHIFRVVEDYRE